MMVITYPELEPEAMLAVPETVKGYIETAGGTVIKSSNESPWGRRRLAYPIRHGGRDIRDGFYTLLYFEAEPEQISDIERDLKLNEQMLRYLLLHLDAMPVFPEPETAEGETGADGETESVATPSSEVVADALVSEESEDDADADGEVVAVIADVVETADGDEVVEVIVVSEEEEED